MDEFLSGRKDGYCTWEYEVVSNTARDSFCDDDNQDFLILQRLLPSFTKIYHVANVANLTQRANCFCGQIFDNRVL